MEVLDLLILKFFYDKIMNEFYWGGLDENKVYMDETNRRMNMSLRITFSRLAEKLIEEGNNEKSY